VSGGEEAAAFVRGITDRIVPLEIEANRAGWEVATGGGEDAALRATRARTELRTLFADAGAAALVRAWRADASIEDPLLRRQLTLLELEFVRNALPPERLRELVELQSGLERIHYGFRAELDGEPATNNRLLEVLRDETDTDRRRAAWAASKQIGDEVAGPLREFVRRRNDAARALGFRDAYAMDLALQEIPEDELFATLAAFERDSEEPFRRLIDGIEARMAARFGVPAEELRPWHWPDPFAQRPPAGDTALDPYFEGRDAVEIASGFFAGIGLPVEAILARSDLYEREGKDQHAFAQDVDRSGDVRILCNLRPTETWMATLLHELGHAVYDDALPRELPFLLRTPSHTLTTESVAMFFGRSTRDPAWLRAVMGVELDGAGAAGILDEQRAAMLVSTRWMLVMAHFERALHADPDRPDLDRLWWELVERFQRIRHPEAAPEGTAWATKMHLALAPVYYHNYLLGELMASQVSAALRAALRLTGDESVAGRPATGAFFRDRIFAPGGTLPWADLMVHATGAPLDARAFLRDFVAGGE
jgi:peptidyl-dipeptidase A